VSSGAASAMATRVKSPLLYCGVMLTPLIDEKVPLRELYVSSLNDVPDGGE
jgi:hypothetical protein